MGIAAIQKEHRKCRVCGKRLKGLQGVSVEERNGDFEGWKSIEIPLCKEHRGRVWQAVKEAMGEV